MTDPTNRTAELKILDLPNPCCCGEVGVVWKGRGREVVSFHYTGGEALSKTVSGVRVRSAHHGACVNSSGVVVIVIGDGGGGSSTGVIAS